MNSTPAGGAKDKVADPFGLATQTALECLSKTAGHHGIDLPVERLKHAYAVAAPLSLNLLLRMAKDAGLRARSTKMDWGALIRLGEAYPALARLTNGNWIVVLGAGLGAEGTEVVSVFDPLADRKHEVLVVDRDRFCAQWSGEIILIKREQLTRDGRRSFGLRWFVPELLPQMATV
ncbi:ABC-type bacteriocin/lantibiotic exporter with double-glycine peptidase domain [Bradyrhizobium sp. LM6.9]